MVILLSSDFKTLIGPSSVNATCQVQYFITFEDAECSLFSSFKDSSFINEADRVCTNIGRGRSFQTDCDSNHIVFSTYDDDNCAFTSEREIVPYDECTQFNDPLTKTSYYVLVRNEVVVVDALADAFKDNIDKIKNDTLPSVVNVDPF